MNRIIGSFESENKGPLLIVIGGIHGNEPAGVEALKVVFQLLKDEPNVNPEFSFKGKLLGLRGNMKALAAKKRFLEKDLNRIWTTKNVAYVQAQPHAALDPEDQELKELLAVIQETINSYQPDKIIVMDIHTTSAKGGIFSIATNHSESHRIAVEFHAPVIKGFLEGIEGTSLHYFQTENFETETIGVCFEAGQHDEPESIKNAVSAIINCLRSIQCVKPEDVENKHDEQLVERAKHLPKVADLIFTQPIGKTDKFKMIPGFSNFQEIKVGELLAYNNQEEVRSNVAGRILMPLYQEQGDDGFFLIKTVEKNK